MQIQKSKNFAKVSIMIVALLCAAMTLFSLNNQKSYAEGPVNIDLLSINDLHGHISDGGTTSAEGGIAEIANIVKCAKAGEVDNDQCKIQQDFRPTIDGQQLVHYDAESYFLQNANTAFVSAGDNISASPFVSFSQQDRPTIAALNEAGLDVSTLGNHEFDKGIDYMKNVTFGPTPNGYGEDTAGNLGISANLYYSSNFIPSNRITKPYYIKIFEGKRVAFIGLTTQDVSSTNAAIFARDLAEEATQLAEDLKTGTGEADQIAAVDAVVILAHEGIAESDCDHISNENGNSFQKLVFAAAQEGTYIDAIISAHTHFAYACNIDYDDGDILPVVQTGSYGQYIGRIKLTIDEGIEANDSRAEIVPLKTKISDKNFTPNFLKDPATQAIVAAAENASSAIEAQPLSKLGLTGTVGNKSAKTISRSYLQNDPDDNRTIESVIGNFFGDQYKWTGEQYIATNTSLPAKIKTDPIIGVINPGGIRANITPKADGTITYGDVATTTPFANEMYIATVTGAKLRLALEQQWQAQVDNENTECPTYIADGNACYKTPTRARLKLGISENVTYTYDEDLVIDPLGNTVCRWQKTYQGGDSKTVVAAEQCTHIVDIFVDGKKIADNDTFTLVSNKFLLPDGGDNFFAFKDANESSDSDGVYNVVNTGKNDLEALVDYFKAHPVITTPDVGRSINTRYNIKDMLQIDFGTSNPFVATEGVHFTVKGSNALLKNRTITVNAHSETTNIDQFLTLGETSVNNEYEVPALPAGNHNITVGLSGIGQVNFPITVPDNNGPLSETGISILAGLIVVVALLLVVASINLKKKKEANLNTVATDENKE